MYPLYLIYLRYDKQQTYDSMYVYVNVWNKMADDDTFVSGG